MIRVDNEYITKHFTPCRRMPETETMLSRFNLEHTTERGFTYVTTEFNLEYHRWYKTLHHSFVQSLNKRNLGTFRYVRKYLLKDVYNLRHLLVWFSHGYSPLACSRYLLRLAEEQEGKFI